MLNRENMIHALGNRLDKYNSLLKVFDKGYSLDLTVHELDEHLSNEDRTSIKNILKESIKVAIDKVEIQLDRFKES